MPRTNYKTSNFDIDLDFSKIYEQEVVDMFENNGTIEVKAERDKWKTTGNIAVELYRIYKDTDKKVYTGVTVSNARWWHISFVLNHKTKRCITMETEELKALVIKFYKQDKYKFIPMGDFNSNFTTYGMLIPIPELMNLENID